jgi:hypothetical protein
MMIARSTATPDRSVWSAIVPPLVIMAAAALLRLPIALAHPYAAALLFLWVASDAMMPGLIARHPRPGWRAGIAAMAMAGSAVLSPVPIRAALVDMPWALAVPVVAIGLHGGWGLWRVVSGCDVGMRDPDRWGALLGEILPRYSRASPWPRRGCCIWPCFAGMPYPTCRQGRSALPITAISSR